MKTKKKETHRDGSISVGKKDQIPPIIIDGVEQVVNEYEETPAKTKGGKILRFLVRFLPFILKSIK